jgi:endoglucanase Acf2
MSNEPNKKHYFQLSAATEYTPLFSEGEQDDREQPANLQEKGKRSTVMVTASVAVIMGVLLVISVLYFPVKFQPEPLLSAAWSSKAEPFSYADPTSLGILSIDRTQGSKPGKILSNLISTNPLSHMPETPLPTNTWYQNLILGDENTNSENKIFQIPHIIDTAGYIPGIRTHPAHLQANDRMVMVSYLLLYLLLHRLFQCRD